MKTFFTNLSRALGGERLLRVIGQSSDVILAFFVITIIMMIIIPVSSTFLDNLIAINMTVSIALMMVALYIPKAVNLSMFPSLLLITTPFSKIITISHFILGFWQSFPCCFLHPSESLLLIF